ncbi:S9 family peptidase [Sinosporangium siamense]|uniref:Peptidase n=1 Tax=Sinosporangium siamense TaxID=1367973 RepID=A0A919RGD3_9ACTN|nr:prolyl oligopeptidase family serine peptidase [Sinosporangium siamense]GII93128.1 peptidase [Sinosporangium siamense]
MGESFPRLQAKTRRFSLGVPRGITIVDATRVVFLRSRGGTDPVTCLWEFDLITATERLIADPRALNVDEENLPPEERARRERAREGAGGIVAYSVDGAVRRAAFALAGGLYVAEIASGEVRHIATPGPAVEPRLSPDGTRIAYVCGGALRVLDLGSGADTALAHPETTTVAYGLADFIAAEELDRSRGFWWSPSSDALLVARVDVAPVQRWFIADPTHPEREPVEHHYPAAGTANARVELFVMNLAGDRVAVPYSQEYLVEALWDLHGLAIVTLSRDQRSLRLLEVDPVTGASTQIREETDEAWVELGSGTPARLSDGTLVWIAPAEGGHRLFIGDRPVTPPTLQVRAVLDIDDDTVLFRASGGDPASVQLWTWAAGVISPITPEPGVYSGTRCAGVTVITSQDMESDGATVKVVRPGHPPVTIPNLAERPGLDLRVSLLRAGARDLSTAVVFPSWHEPGSARLPVLMDPYGGPHAQRVLTARSAYLTSQWFAEQGFAVVVVDGRGTPGRGPAFEREILDDLAGPILDDQVDALAGVAKQFPGDLDLTRVGIRGWSFGGYLAALAVLRRPDVFHSAVAGAPVTEWRLYDTAYTERYLGDPKARPHIYDQSSLFDDAGKLDRPLLLIHGLADDNVVAAHTLKLSSALMAAGRPHTVLPLSGVTHMTPQEVVAENLLLLQVEFLKRTLGMS